ncbi:MAG: PAS domain S-box protein [Gemmatimonadaceae bacterium]
MNTQTPSSTDAIGADTLAMLQGRTTALLNAIDDGIYLLDQDGMTVFINEAAARMLGYANREVIGKSMHDLTHARYADGTPFPAEACPIIASVTASVQQRVGGDTFWTKAGQPLLVDYTSIPLKDGRSVVGVVVTFRDISEQQFAAEQSERLTSERQARADAEAAREALRASEARYRFLAEAIPVQIWTAQPSGALDYVTQRVADYFGLTTEQILVDGWKDIVHPEDLPMVAARWMHSLATGEPYEVEFRLRSADGQYRWHLSRALAQRDDSGTISGWFGTNTLIEDQKRNAAD